MNISKIQYLIRSLSNSFQKPTCPSCGSTNHKTIDRKFIVTSLKECEECNIYYRFPGDATDFNKEFYQEDYIEKGLTTDLPSSAVLKKLIETSFKNSEKDFTFHIDLIKSILNKKKEIKILDFGANWGYASYQFKKSGFEVESFEISKHKVKFAKQLGIDIKTDLEHLGGDLDVFFSSHVIEHHPHPNEMIALAKKLLKKDGVMITFCPNGSDELRNVNFQSFHKYWGMVHPNYFADKYFTKNFNQNPYYITSSANYNEIEKQVFSDQKIGDTSGLELLVIAQPNMEVEN